MVLDKIRSAIGRGNDKEQQRVLTERERKKRKLEELRKVKLINK